MKPETLGDLERQRNASLAKSVYNRETGSKNGALGDLRDGNGVSMDAAEKAQKSVKRQASIKKNRRKRTVDKRTDELMKKPSRARGKEKSLIEDAAGAEVYGGYTGEDYIKEGLAHNLAKRGRTN